MARGDVRIAVTLACEDCKRRNYQTNKSKRNNPDRIALRKYCKWCRRHTEPPGDPLAGALAVARDVSARSSAAHAAPASRAAPRADVAAPHRANVPTRALDHASRRERRPSVERPRHRRAGADGARRRGRGADDGELDGRERPSRRRTSSRAIERRPTRDRRRRAPRERDRRSRPRASPGRRASRFLARIWAELQRVQWPDRRQVGQATAVVLGFVVIAGGYLGLLDAVSQAPRQLHPLARPTPKNHVSLVRRQHLLRPREQGQAEPRAPRRLAEPEARRAPGRRARPRPSRR